MLLFNGPLWTDRKLFMRIACNFEFSATKSQTRTTIFSSHFFSFNTFQVSFERISVFDEWNKDIIVLKLTEIIKLIAHTRIAVRFFVLFRNLMAT